MQSQQGKIRARRTAIQAYYQWLLNNQPMEAVIKEFEQDRKELKKADTEYFRELLSGMSEHVDKLEDTLTRYIDRNLTEINPVERAVLCLGTYEMMFKPDIPLRVVVNEAIELAKMFGAEESYKYVNGVLDKVAKDLRTVESQV